MFIMQQGSQSAITVGCVLFEWPDPVGPAAADEKERPYRIRPGLAASQKELNQLTLPVERSTAGEILLIQCV